jgi:hypothetical protein
MPGVQHRLLWQVTPKSEQHGKFLPVDTPRFATLKIDIQRDPEEKATVKVAFFISARIAPVGAGL